ncbi:immunoglobulin-like domain-containing protein [Clostridium sp.]|uniref:immunoglobulin-like domain-containing protein n=1 Tax=Clostridium sp. TaxID=1506 RepID=UPI0026738E3E|nr:immunoglobulin-like domain-containing protein [Clostridium sp.]MCI7030620.1 DUF5011 domain-containing protein [Clostridium sp.]
MKKVNTKTKVIALSTAAVMTTAIYLKSDNITNAEQYAKITDNAIELNVDKQDKDTIKLYLSNFSDLAKSLHLSVKIEGNAKFTDDSINWLVKSEANDLKTDVKISNDKKQMDIFVLSTSNIEIDGGILEICEIDVTKENKNSTEGYKVVPNVDAEGVAYNYIINETNKQVKGSDIVNSSLDKLTINSAPVISLIDSPKIVEGNIILKTGEIFKPLDYVKATDDEDGEITNITANSNGVDNKKPGSYKVTYVATDKEGESTTFEAIVVVEEAKQSVSNPVMTVTNKNIQIRQGETFDPLNGVIATDYQGRKLTVTVTGTYDVEALGSYVLTYTATDAYGNTVTDTATLEVVKQNAPVINGVKSEVTIEVGQAFDPLENVTATDFAGNAVEVKVTGTYDVNVPGEYTITYKAVDKYGTESAEMKTILKVVEKSNNNETPDNNGNGSGNGGTDSGNNGSDSENGGNDSGNNGSDSGNGGTDSGNNGSDSGNGGTDSGNNGSDSGNGGNDSENNGNNSVNGGSNSENNSQNGSNISGGNSNNGSTTAGNNNSTSNNAGGTNTNPSKIPTTGAAVSNYVIGGIGAIVSIIGAYLFKKKK